MKIMKSKVVALVVAFMMVFSLVAVPVSAADDAVATTVVTSDDAAKFLSEKNLLQGDDNGDLMLGNELTREQMMVIISRLLGVEDEAQNYSTEEMTFKDVPTDNGYAPYVAWAQAEGITQGHSEEEFGFNEALTAWQTKAFFVRALGYVDTTDEEMDAKADELGINAGSDVESEAAILRGEMAVLMYNTLHAKNAEGVVLGEAIGVLEPAVVNAKEVKEVKMVNESAMKVVFDGPVADTTAAKFEVAGAMVVTPTVTWNNDKTEATLTSAGIYLDGTYTVKVTGLELKKAEATIIVSKNGVAKIEILGDKLVRTGDETGEVSVKLTDSYGNDVTEKYAYDVEVKASRGAARIKDAKKGIVEVDIHDAGLGESNDNWKDYPITPELVTLTVYSKSVVGSSIATANAVLTVTELTKVDKVELSPVVLPTGATKIVLGKTNAGYIVVKAKDQFGREITDINLLAAGGKISNLTADQEKAVGVFYSISDTKVKDQMELREETNSNGDKEFRLYINLSGITGRDYVRNVTVQTISKLTGTSSNVITLPLKEGKVPYRVTLGSPAQVVAVGDTFDENIVIPMFVYDEDGVQLTPDEIADNASKFDIDSSAETFFGLKVATSGTNKGKLVGVAIPDAKGTQTIIVKIDGSVTAPATTTVDVKDTAEARSLRFKVAPATNLLYNSKVEFEYEFIDQYGRVMDKDMLKAVDVSGTANDRAKTEVKLTISGTDKGSSVIASGSVPVLTTGTTVDAEKLVGEKAIAVSAKQLNGTFSLKVELLKPATANVLSTLDRTFTVAEGVPTSLAFEIATVPTIKGLTVATAGEVAYNLTDATDPVQLAAMDAVGVTNDYAQEIVVTAKDANGNIFAVPADRILSWNSSDASIIRVAKDTDGAVMVYGLQSTFTGETVTSKDVTITVQVGTDTEAKSVSTKVTVSKNPSVVQQVLFIDTDPAAQDTELPDNYKEVKEVTLNDATAAAKFYVVTKDQYGVYKKVADPTLTVVNKDKTSLPELDYVTDKLATGVNTLNVRQNSTIILMYSVDGAYGTINVRTGASGVEDGVAFDTSAPTPAIAVATNATTNDVDSLVITFNEALADPTTHVALADGDVKSHFTAGAGASITTATYNAAAHTVTFVLASVVDNSTLVIDASELADAAGNAVATKTYTYHTTGTLWN